MPETTSDRDVASNSGDLQVNTEVGEALSLVRERANLAASSCGRVPEYVALGAVDEVLLQAEYITGG